MKVFLSHSSKDLSLATEFKDGVLSPVFGNENIYFSSLPESGTRPGDDWQDTIEEKIKAADEIVLLVTDSFDASKICQRELGMAMILNKHVIAILLRESWDDPLRKLQFLSIHEEDGILLWLEEVYRTRTGKNLLVGPVRRKLSDLRLRVDQYVKQEILGRGEVFEDIMDATFSIVSNNQPMSLKEDIRGFLTKEVIPEKFLYQTVTGARRWMELCGDPLYYAFSESLKFLDKVAEQVIGTIDAKVLESSPDFVSLGPGTGHKDVRLLTALLDRCGDNKSLFYYPFDISKRMLESVHEKMVLTENLKRNIRIKCIEAEFDDLALFYNPVFNWRKEPNIVSFLGNTLGNMPNEVSFLEMLCKTMHFGDYFILEVRLNSGVTQAPGGQDEKRKAFNLSPLEELGVKINPESLRYDSRGAALSQIQGTTSIKGIYDRFTFEGKEYNNTTLCCINLYDSKQMDTVLNAVGFDILLYQESEDRSLGLWVTRKKKK